MNRKKMIMAVCLIVCFVSVASPVHFKVLAAQKDADEVADTSAGTDTGTGGFVIDNQNIYEGMESSYSGGYMPKTDGKKAVVVLPLLAKRKIAGNRMTVTLRFGDSGNQPFVQKNYEKTVRFGYHTAGKKAQPARSGKKEGCYLVTFNLQLKKERDNGSYPVTISVNAEDRNGNAISQEFTVFVSITDGRGAQGGGDRGRTPSFAPKIILSSCQFSKDRILCGKKYTAEFLLKNTSTEKAIKNMMVRVVPGENIELMGKTGSTYVKELESGGNCSVPFKFRVNAAAPAGQYSIGVTLDYADSSGNTYTGEETIKVSAEQEVRIGIDPVQIPREIQLGDSMVLQTQAVNLGKGKLYNIRAVLEADGLSPVSSAYMGDAEAGVSLSGSMEVVAEGLSGDSLYGNTQGKVTFYYEDEGGNEMTQVQDFETAILSPLKGDEEEKPADHTDQWWVIMAVIMIFSGVAAVSFFVYKKRTAQRGTPDEN